MQKNSFIVALLILAAPCFALDDLIAISGNVYAAGVPLALGDVQFKLSYDSCATFFYDSGVDFNGAIVNGQFDIYLGNASLTALVVDPTQRYIYVQEIIDGNLQDWNNVGGDCQIISNQFYMNNETIDQRITAAGVSKTYFFDITAATYDGSQSGYSGMNAICAGEYAGTHMCSLEELLATVNDKALQPEWTGYAWYNTGGSKYPLGSSPADDCAGWNDNTASKLGSFWIFGTGYADAYGAIVNCGESKSIACCKAW